MTQQCNACVLSVGIPDLADPSPCTDLRSAAEFRSWCDCHTARGYVPSRIVMSRDLDLVDLDTALESTQAAAAPHDDRHDARLEPALTAN